jgi:hypothetical protein
MKVAVVNFLNNVAIQVGAYQMNRVAIIGQRGGEGAAHHPRA